jgi:acyl carrier protein
MTKHTPAAIEDQIIALARARFDWLGDIPADADLRGGLDLDSLHLVVLQVAIEDHFRVAFDPLDEQLVEAFRTLRHLASYVEDLLVEEG